MHTCLRDVSNVLFILFSFSLFSILWAKDYRISITPFKHSFSSYFYFDDSTVILYHDTIDQAIWRSDNEGVSWTKVKDIPHKKTLLLIRHPFNNSMAFVLGKHTKHYYTTNQGLTWKKFTTELPFERDKVPLNFNSANSNYIIYLGADCPDSKQSNCIYKAYYTEDGFSTEPKLLKENTKTCVFSKSSKEFTEGSDKLVFCIYVDSKTGNENLHLIKSDDWFSSYSYVSFGGNPLVNINGFGTIQTFIIAIIKSLQSSKLEMYVSKDGNSWNKAKFPSYHQEKLKEDSYTIMKSYPYSLQVDILVSSEYPHYGGISFKSDNSGVYFITSIEHTNRNEDGYVDFEDVQYLDGIILANIIENWKEGGNNINYTKKIQSRISFDNGYTWELIKSPKDSNCNTLDSKLCSLHLYSVTNNHKNGRIFSSYSPGILIGIGSVGPNLRPYNECDLFISENAGRTWNLSLKGVHKYESANGGNIIIAIPDKETRDLYYTLDRGKNWELIDIGISIYPQILITAPNSKKGKFIIVSSQSKDSADHNSVNVVSIDLSNVYSQKCVLNKTNLEKSDLEKWYVYHDETGCLMGHKQYFWRKKVERKCFIEKNHTEFRHKENCPCSDDDYECDYNFIHHNNRCLEYVPQEIPQNECKNSNDMFLGLSGYRKIPGNTCDDKYGVMKDKKIKIPCSKGDKNSYKKYYMFNIMVDNYSDKIIVKSEDFKGDLINYFYIKSKFNDPNDPNDTIIILTSEMEIYISHNQGNEWTQILEKESIISIFQNNYADEEIYLLGFENNAWVSRDRFTEIEKITLPAYSHIGYTNFEFHPDNKNWIIYTGCKEKELLRECEAISYYSIDGGKSWSLLMSDTRSCSWVKTDIFDTNKNLIYCEVFASDLEKSLTAPVKLIYSFDFFNNYYVLYDSIIGYARFEKFIILAQYDYKSKNLKPFVSLDGLNFTHANFPSHYSGEAYTILDSTTGTIFLHITTSNYKGIEWGSILKSNSNGTNFVKLLDFVNRDSDGFVDFERLKGLEGIILTNVVVNSNDVIKGAPKHIKTLITYNDGGEWVYLTPPEKDSNGDKYCSGKLEKCSLNLHGYTERVDFRNTFSSDKVPGLDFAVGNVGEYLDNYLNSNTFMTKDGGITWKEVQKGPYMWKFGDQGSILLLTKDKYFSDHFYYSLDMGNTWQIVYFPSKESFLVYDITTVYSDTSRKFVLFCIKNKSSSTMTTIYIDFTMLTDKKCELNEEFQDKSDFDIWSFQYPKKSSCLFGHVKNYYRKKPNRLCFIGNSPIKYYISKNCTCEVEDYECDYNYERVSNGTCQLVKGVNPPNHLDECKKYNLIEYYKPTGYRRIPLTTCQGGKELDKDSLPIPCPGKESEYRKLRKSLGGFGLFLIIISPFIIIILSGYCMWALYRDRFLGQIRLGEDETPSGWIQYPIILVNKIIDSFLMIPAAISYIKTVIVSLFSGSRRFSTRDSFSRNNYSILLPNSPEFFYEDYES
ncbi:uncharacterized protein T551_03301 [Pneumocystis jirovecii RU7]|uniref:VPS10 domain-containing protein n=1 Tax=Pneumocystis jirovecii (strain RU7) TaxID=1408657 RepID=A0A0W4ZEN6_PNEJ7|nr:uncharacterized protein T551_03301 [Pneumocystis jirovecii RU7]KTW26839.1 hypothetical protein T551_03301 [Pneumocystis jirovecii RU7]